MLFFFFFKQKTAYEMRISDWSSDVCSSDLARGNARLSRGDDLPRRDFPLGPDVAADDAPLAAAFPAVGGCCRSLASRARRHDRGGAVADLRRFPALAHPDQPDRPRRPDRDPAADRLPHPLSLRDPPHPPPTPRT